MAHLNFNCRKCGSIFDSNVGEITFSRVSDQRPKFENDIVCPKCGVITINEVLLTELGQTQITEIHLGSMQ